MEWFLMPLVQLPVWQILLIELMSKKDVQSKNNLYPEIGLFEGIREKFE